MQPITGLVHESLPQKPDLRWPLFVISIGLTTLLPFVVMPLAVHFGEDVTSLLFTSIVINFLGGHAHVASTAFFYSDPAMREHLRDHKLRYVAAPILLICGIGLAFTLLPTLYTRYILLFHFLWQTHHYQRQNLGVLSFLTASTDRSPVTGSERKCLNLAVYCGMAALIKVYGLSAGTIFEPWADLIYRAAGWMYLGVPALLIVAVVTQVSLRNNPLRLAALILFSSFYIPSFVFNDPAAATLGYALAHGLQYLVFMLFVGVSRPRPFIGLAAVGIFALSGGLILTAMTMSLGDSLVSRALFGAALGAVMSHFVVDAGIWKLRQGFQRRYMRQAFSFLFDR